MLLVAQDGDGPWQPLSPALPGFAKFEVTSGRYGYAFACERIGLRSRVEVRFDTPANAAPTSLCAPSTIPPPTFTISGTTAPNARVFAGSDVTGGETVADDTGAYVLETVSAGLHDVIAVLDGSPSKMMIVRDVDLATDRAVNLPIATGVELSTVTPTIDGAAGDAVTVVSELWTANRTRAVVGSGTTVVAVPPAGILIAGDVSSIGASVRAGADFRYVQRAFESAPPTLEVPAAIGAEVDETQARWVGDWQSVHLALAPPPASGRVWRVGYAASREWVTANGDQTLSIVDVRALPGWTDTIAVAEPGESVTWSLNGSSGDVAADYEISGAQGMR
ncbi:MAG TPA: hypothetical protein VIU61_04045 [Kofleriaceae bacterium]